ncbi:ferrochelatase [Dermabacter sp. p3-SID358]|uniref:ferrochelatase n=1 Tax=Dermabacter sp. p3-SID358 TaxID=2916114 RepID=UPI0021A91B18|nr:ferrochelatase [Dermabacter sp. p3-SID358]MCT1866889.1 ferrochelatase [Dermabacter sp. p3-SID358]
MTHTAILFSSFGGPEKQEDVIPFLRNVTRGRGIPDERLEEVATHYRALGGKSPINEQNRDLIARLEAELKRRELDIPVYWGNRNWEPYVADTVRQMHEDGHTKVVGLVTSAYSSYSSCHQYHEDFRKALSETGLEGTVEIDKARVYYNHPGFLEPVVDAVSAAIREHREGGHDPSAIEILFSTHSIPTSMADVSGPKSTWEKGSGGWYVAQHEAAIEYVMNRVREELGAENTPENAQLVYQSRSGAPHVPWLEPDINDVIDELEDRSAVIVVPIGFVTDHVEVVWDLDTEAKESAEKKGLAFIRVATSGSDDRFIGALADLVEEAVTPGFERRAVIDVPGALENEGAAGACGLECCLVRTPEGTFA